MKINKKVFQKYEILNFWCDYLRLVWKGEKLKVSFADIFSVLDRDNSNFYIDEFHWLTYVKIRTSNWDALIASISVFGFSVPIFQVVVFDRDKVELFRSLWKIDFYGSFFRLGEINFLNPLEYMHSVFWENINNLLISRIDYKWDFVGVDVETISKYVTCRKNSRVDKIYKWRLLTFWVGSKSSKRVYLRVYDKIEDILYKWKSYFYSDYLKYKDDWITRLEFEFLNHFCKWYTLSSLKSLEEKIFTYVWFVDSWKKYIYFEDKSNIEVDKLYSVRNFVGRWKKLLEMWENPFLLLYNYLLKEHKKEDILKLVEEFYWDF